MARVLQITGDITTESFGLFLDELNQLLREDMRSPVSVTVCSEGGSAMAALAYYDLIKMSECKIIMVATGIVASAASLIFMAGHERYMTKNAWLMVHDDSVDDVTNLRVCQVEKNIKHQRRLEVQWNELFHACVPEVSVEEWDAYHREEVYFTAQECLQNGFIHGILGGEKL